MVHRARLAVVGAVVGGTFACGSPEEPDGLTDAGIRLDPIVEIGDRDGQGYIGRPVTLTQDSQGRIWVVSEESDHRISVFDRSGRFEREVGRRGEGPEEFQNITAVVAVPGDTIVAFDNRNRRRVAITADGVVVRAEPVDISVYSAQVGADVASWAGDGSVWLTPAFEYRLERWSATGEPLERWSREAEWMPPGQPWRAATPEVPPTPTIRILTVDDAGRIWTGITVGEPDWARALGEPRGNLEGPGQLLADRGHRRALRHADRGTRPGATYRARVDLRRRVLLHDATGRALGELSGVRGRGAQADGVDRCMGRPDLKRGMPPSSVLP
jgi:hypothetical protein